jgi:hypothetical protein
MQTCNVSTVFAGILALSLSLFSRRCRCTVGFGLFDARQDEAPWLGSDHRVGRRSRNRVGRVVTAETIRFHYVQRSAWGFHLHPRAYD